MRYKSSEKLTQKHVLDYLEFHGYWYQRNNSGLMFYQGRRIVLAPPGSCDVLTCIKGTGQLVGLEIKDAKGYQNDNQKRMQKKMESVGAIYAVVRSMNDLEEILTPTRGLGATEQDRAMLQDLDGFSGSRIGSESEIAHNRPEREDEAA